MNIYRLKVIDRDDSDYEDNVHYTHATKNSSDLWEDYNTAAESVINNNESWNNDDILDALETMGWARVEIQTVEVEF